MADEETQEKSLQGRILVVDDDKETREFLTEFLHCIGFSEITTAGSGQEALKKFQQFHPRLVLLDYRLPDLDGLKVLKRIKEIQPTLPVIMMTAFPNTHGIEGVVEQGAFDLVLKPLDLFYLEQSILTGFAG